MTVDEAKKAVLTLAASEVGYHEKASNASLDDKTANSGGGNWTKYARDLDAHPNFYNGAKNGYAWCDVFVDWLFVKTFGETIGREMLCQPEKSLGAGCLYSAQYYKQVNRWYRQSPQIGDQIFFSYSAGEYSHTGIVEMVNGDTITTIEGNTSDTVGRRTYNKSNPVIAGFGRPRWDLAVQDWEKPFIVVENGQVINSSEWAKEEGKMQERHGWTPPALKYDPDIYSEDCKIMQGLLNVRNFDSGDSDGYFGALTQAAVYRAQRFYGLMADGECDDALWGKLLER